jgi:threonine/homoserine/homoserine lactone efflux protein
MHDHLQLFLLALFTGFSGAMMPGPMFAATVKETVRSGAGAGPRVVAGHAVVEALLVAALAGGIGATLGDPATVRRIALWGGAVLVVFGLLTLRDARGAADTLAGPAEADGKAGHPVLAGLVTTVTNPYFYVWWSGIGLDLGARAATLGRAGYATFFAGHILADLSWYALVSVLLSQGRQLGSPRVLRAILLLCGVALAGLGVKSILSALFP